MKFKVGNGKFKHPATGQIQLRKSLMALSEIQQSFYARSFDMASIRWWLVGLAVVILFLLGFLVVRAIRAGREKYRPYGCIVDRKAIRGFIRSAFDQRRPFEVQIQITQGQRRPTLRCSPDHLGADTMTLEVSGLKSLSNRWVDRAVVVFFRVMIEKDFTYYTFASRIAAINLPWSGVCQIVLPIPDALENRQKRSFLRLPPPREFFPGAAIWCGDQLPKPDDMADIAKWPRPRLLYIANRMEQFKILDLSAGGVRCCVPGHVAKTLQLHFTTAEHLILMLDLFDPEQNKKLRFWAECRVQNIWIEYATRDVHLGLQFCCWARSRIASTPGGHDSGMDWLKLSSSNEVEPIGNWIMRRHLEMFRENPVDNC